MTQANINLKTILAHFGILNSTIAQELSVDPSLISRWLSGKRQLKASSEIAQKLAEYILNRCFSPEDTEWFCEEFRRAGLRISDSSNQEMLRSLILFISSDGEKINRSFLSNNQTELSPSALSPLSDALMATPLSASYDLRIGIQDITQALELSFSALPKRAQICIFLSNENVDLLLSESVNTLLTRMIKEKKVTIQILLSLSSNTFAISNLISTYMRQIISGNLHISIINGMSQSISNQTIILFPERQAFMITDLSSLTVQPVATIVSDTHFVREISKNYERSMRNAQTIMSLLNDKFGKNIIEIYYVEYCLPGDLDVIKDNINPMFMTLEAYGSLLRDLGNRDEALDWRNTEYAKFRQLLIENLQNGSVFREIISLRRLETIASDGYCMMPGQYFMDKQMVRIDKAACINILQGYIHFLEQYPHFHLLILDELRILDDDSCWHLKQNHHIAINSWEDVNPTMIYSEQMMVTHEFQLKFNELWLKETVASGGKEQTIRTLRHIIDKMSAA